MASSSARARPTLGHNVAARLPEMLSNAQFRSAVVHRAMVWR